MSGKRSSAGRVAIGLCAASMLLTGFTAPVNAVAEPDVCAEVPFIQPGGVPDTSTFASDGMITFIGHRVSVLPGSQWLDLYPNEGLWTLYFHWMLWLAPIVDADPLVATNIFLDEAQASPDPGFAAGHAELARTGWLEFAVMSRLKVANCLWHRTGDERLRPVIQDLADASMDPLRYYGPPRFRAHNHGLMSNRALYTAGVLLDMPQWSEYAVTRLHESSVRAFDRCGLAFEQSLRYQEVNAYLWPNTNREVNIAFVPDTTFIAGHRTMAALARPDGVVEPIGDGYPSPVRRVSTKKVWCPASGWIAGTVRGSHYTLRGGPARWTHGHEDHGSITWFAHGIPVLSERGTASRFDLEAIEWSRGMDAHSVFAPSGVITSGATRMARVIPNMYQLSDRPEGSSRQREVRFTESSLTVKDSAASPDSAARWKWTQHWQLAPGWTPDSSGSGAIYGDGAQLRISCLGARVTFVPVLSYLSDGTTLPAWDAQCIVRGSSVVLRTTLTVTPA